MNDTDFPRQLAQMEAEQCGDLLPCGWCGLHHDQGTCKRLYPFAGRWKTEVGSGCPHEIAQWVDFCVDHSPEYLDALEEHSGERVWGMRANQGSDE